MKEVMSIRIAKKLAEIIKSFKRKDYSDEWREFYSKHPCPVNVEEFIEKHKHQRP